MGDRKRKNVHISKGDCVNLSTGKFLNEFNAIRLDQKQTMDDDRFREIIRHLKMCKFCRRQLTYTGKEILTSEMLWNGDHLNGKQRIKRRQMRTKLSKASASQRIKLMEKILRKFSTGEFTEELKKIEKFLEN